MSRSIVLVAVLAVAATAAAADPIDDFLRSPGSTGDARMAARMFAWCSARYELVASLGRDDPARGPRWSDRLDEQALGARAAGAYRLYAEWQGDGAPPTGEPAARELDFGHYLVVVEGMAAQDASDIGRRLAEGAAPPSRVEAVIEQLDAEGRRCQAQTTRLQQIQVARMTPGQIAAAKSRPHLVYGPGPQRPR